MTRKAFISGTMALTTNLAFPSISSSQKTLRIALLGCGGRGKGALNNIFQAAQLLGIKLEVKAICDYFLDKAEEIAKQFNIANAKYCIGANGYKEVMAMQDVDAVLLVEPIGFRPLHFKAAVEAGKHVFEEKAVAVDGPGIRMHIDAARESVRKGLTVVAGTQRRHCKPYILQARALRARKLAPICAGRVRYLTAARRLYVRDIEKDKLNKDYLIKNWNNFDCLAGDHIVEQHVHNLDVACWFIGRSPISAVSFGLRARALTGNQYDFFSTDFDFGDDVFIHSQCRQINDTYQVVDDMFRTEANQTIYAGLYAKNKDKKDIDLSEFDDGLYNGSAYVSEHINFLKSIFSIGPYFNEGEQVAISTACGVMANFSAKYGEKVNIIDLLSNKSSKFYDLQLKPTALDFEKDEDVEMPEYEDDQFQIPGTIALPRLRTKDDDEWMPAFLNQRT